MAQKWSLEPSGRWVRAKFNGETVADSKRVMLLIESNYEIHYYFPKEDVKTEFLIDSGETDTSGYKGLAHLFTLKVGDKSVENAAWTFPNLKDNRPDLRDYIAFKWNAMDHWYEEDEEVFGHPRNPYHRIDTIQSSRHIRVEVDGVTVAETNRPFLLFETGLPTRYYIPKEDVNFDYLTPTDTETICPYKGFAAYWSVNVNGTEHKDLVWGYPHPFSQQSQLKDAVAFYNEKLDIYVDGELEEKPRTVFA